MPQDKDPPKKNTYQDECPFCKKNFIWKYTSMRSGGRCSTVYLSMTKNAVEDVGEEVDELEKEMS